MIMILVSHIFVFYPSPDHASSIPEPFAFLLKERGWDTHSATAVVKMISIPPLRKTPPAL